ncbi:MAG: hypothetical protein WDN45_02715 [Caulobacteraceae bacterium]
MRSHSEAGVRPWNTRLSVPRLIPLTKARTLHRARARRAGFGGPKFDLAGVRSSTEPTALKPPPREG